jgi:hypothetical protein
MMHLRVAGAAEHPQIRGREQQRLVPRGVRVGDVMHDKIPTATRATTLGARRMRFQPCRLKLAPAAGLPPQVDLVLPRRGPKLAAFPSALCQAETALRAVSSRFSFRRVDEGSRDFEIDSTLETGHLGLVSGLPASPALPRAEQVGATSRPSSKDFCAARLTSTTVPRFVPHGIPASDRAVDSWLGRMSLKRQSALVTGSLDHRGTSICEWYHDARRRVNG